MSEPSAPDFVSSDDWSTVPCGGVSRKLLQAYATPAATSTPAIPYSSRFHFLIVIVLRPLNKRRVASTWPLECGRDTDRDRAIRGVRPLVDPAELIAGVAGRAERAPRRQGGVEPRVSGERQQILGLQIHACGRNPADDRGRQAVADLQRAEPHVRTVLDPVARELTAEHVAHVHAGILGVRIRYFARTGVAAACARRAWAVEHHRVGQQVRADVGIEIAEHVPVLLRIEDLVAERPEDGGTDLPRTAPHGEIEPAGEVGMRAADDRPVGPADRAVTIQVLELDTTGARAVIPERCRVGGILVIAFRDETVERADRIPDHVDHGVLLTQRDGSGERLRPQVVDLENLVLIVAAVERYAPQRPRADRVVIAERDVDAGIAHLADVDDRRGRGAGGRRWPGVEPQVVRVPAIPVGAERAPALQEFEIQPDVHRALLFPLE